MIELTRERKNSRQTLILEVVNTKCISSFKMNRGRNGLGKLDGEVPKGLNFTHPNPRRPTNLGNIIFGPKPVQAVTVHPTKL